MAFKIWQIGLHLQQQEAVAIVRGAKECFLQCWWRLPLENDIIKDGRIVDAQRLAKTLLPWSRELPPTPRIIANAKLRMESPPRMKIHSNTIKVLSEVLIVRAKVVCIIKWV